MFSSLLFSYYLMKHHHKHHHVTCATTKNFTLHHYLLALNVGRNNSHFKPFLRVSVSALCSVQLHT